MCYLGSTTLKNFAQIFGENEVDISSPYVEIQISDPYRRLIVKKTSLCWLLRKSSPKLSSDRLLRVRNNEGNKKIKIRNKKNKRKNNEAKKYYRAMRKY